METKRDARHLPRPATCHRPAEMETKTAKDLNDLRGGNSSEETDDPEKFEAEKANKRLRLLYTWLEKSRVRLL